MNTLNDNNMILVFKGPFTLQVVSSLGEFIRSLPIDDAVSKSRLFKSLIEIAQNISLYSAEKVIFKHGKQTGFGILHVEEDEKHYIIRSKNKIDSAEFDKLDVYCNKIKGLNQEELRKLKTLNIRNKKEKENSAHLGFIYVALLTTNNIDFRLDKTSGNIEITVRVNKRYVN